MWLLFNHKLPFRSTRSGTAKFSIPICSPSLLDWTSKSELDKKSFFVGKTLSSRKFYFRVFVWWSYWIGQGYLCLNRRWIECIYNSAHWHGYNMKLFIKKMLNRHFLIVSTFELFGQNLTSGLFIGISVKNWRFWFFNGSNLKIFTLVQTVYPTLMSKPEMALFYFWHWWWKNIRSAMCL